MDNLPNKTILITVDVEDWFQVENLRAHFPHSSWDKCENRVISSTHALLELFANHGISCTFFVLGWLAERYPGLVKDIHVRGHEVASHGYSHELCSDKSFEELKDDLFKSKALLENITGGPVIGYRAPSFSVTHRLIKALHETGYIYDSSYNSFAMNGRYGRLDGKWTKNTRGILESDNGIVEIPVSNLKLFNKILPWGGGGFFRLYPLSLFKYGVKKILSFNCYYMFYCHPWEFDLGQPRVKGLRPDFRFRHYVNIANNIQKIDSFLSTFSECNFLRCRDFLSR